MKKTILLIDDNKYLLDIFVIRFTRCLRNYKILTARNGQRGIEILKTAPVALVLVDLDMPEVDGYQFIEYAMKHHPAIPVFVMSNNCSAQEADRLRSLGVAECIEKPFLIEDVTRSIANQLKRETGLAGMKSEPQLVPSS
jgi:DNA-binding NtrC family response regulator